MPSALESLLQQIDTRRPQIALQSDVLFASPTGRGQLHAPNHKRPHCSLDYCAPLEFAGSDVVPDFRCSRERSALDLLARETPELLLRL